MSYLTAQEKMVCIRLMRLLGYLAVLVGEMLLVWRFAEAWARDAFMENGIVENLQCYVLGIAALIFGWEAYKYKSCRLGLLGLMSLCLLAIFANKMLGLISGYRLSVGALDLFSL